MMAYSWLRRALRQPTLRGLLSLTFMLAVLPGCNAFAPQTPLAFQTLAQHDQLSSLGSPDGKSNIRVAATGQEGTDLANQLQGMSVAVTDQLRQLDYHSAFALLVVRQSVGSSGFQITVPEIIRQGDQVTIRVQFGSPNPNEVQLQVFTAPYHLVTVSKSGTWGQPIHFIMMTDNQMIAETTHFIP